MAHRAGERTTCREISSPEVMAVFGRTLGEAQFYEHFQDNIPSDVIGLTDASRRRNIATSLRRGTSVVQLGHGVVASIPG